MSYMVDVCVHGRCMCTTKKNRKIERKLETYSLLQFRQLPKRLLDSDSSELRNQLGSTDVDNGCILSQDFFCTQDYPTPDNQNLMIINQDHSPCPRSPVKLNTVKSKRCRQESHSWSSQHRVDEQENDDDDDDDDDDIETDEDKNQIERSGYVSKTAVALRSSVTPPPCLKNPYFIKELELPNDPFRHKKCANFLTTSTGGDVLSRYITDFHEIQKIGVGHFSEVYKVLNRIDGCLYAIKRSTRDLSTDSERVKAMMEAQALAALGFHENVVGYYSSWIENKKFYIQLELCEQSLSKKYSLNTSKSENKIKISGREILLIMHQVAKALQYVHEKGIAHLDVKPDNIYIKNGVCKLGDFGNATRLDKSLRVDEGDARYMPQEILNENYNHLDRVDIFSLGITVYELIKGSPLTESRNQLLNIKEGKLPLLPGHSCQLQQLLKMMMDKDPRRRPTATEILNHSVFDRIRG